MDDYEGDAMDGPWYVIPHHSSLDYCKVEITSHAPDKHGRVFVRGKRYRGWRPDGAEIRTRVPLDKLTLIDSDTVPFMVLYDDPCHPKVS